MGNLIQELESEFLKQDVPVFGPGDTVVVHVKVVEGERERSRPSRALSSRAESRNQLVFYGA